MNEGVYGFRPDDYAASFAYRLSSSVSFTSTSPARVHNDIVLRYLHGSGFLVCGFAIPVSTSLTNCTGIGIYLEINAVVLPRAALYRPVAGCNAAGQTLAGHYPLGKMSENPLEIRLRAARISGDSTCQVTTAQDVRLWVVEFT